MGSAIPVTLSVTGKISLSDSELPPITPADIHVLLAESERLSRLVVGNLFRRSGYRGTEFSSSACNCLAAMYIREFVVTELGVVTFIMMFVVFQGTMFLSYEYLPCSHCRQHWCTSFGVPQRHAGGIQSYPCGTLHIPFSSWRGLVR